MKTKIRRGVFETNSSSVHSICIASDPKNQIFPREVNFSFGTYGWEFRTYRNLQDKANYLYTGMCGVFVSGDGKLEEAKDFIKETLATVNVECTFSDVKVHYTDNYSYYDVPGYVDHSYNLWEFLNAILSDPDKLIHYLFSDLSYVATGNDNSEYPSHTDRILYPHDIYVKGN